MPKFRVGIIGLGFRLGYLGHVFTAIDQDFGIAGYVDPNPAGLPSLQRKGVDPGKKYETAEEMVKNEKLDLLMIGTPNHLHLENIKFGLEHGLKVFCEKPIVMSLEQTYELAKLLAKYGHDRLIVGLVLRYSPHIKRVMEAKKDGLLGDIVSIEAAEHIAPYHGAFFMRDWRRYEHYSGGFLLEKCCHDLDLYTGVVGKRPIRVASFGGRKTFIPENKPKEGEGSSTNLYHVKPCGWEGSEKVFESDANIVDHQTAIVEYEGGETLAFHTNMNVPDEFRRFAIMGTKGMAEADFIRGYLWIHDAQTGKKIVDEKYAKETNLSQHYGADEQMAVDVLAHVRDGVPLPVSAVDAMEAGLLAMAIDEARKTKKVVEMEPMWKKFDEYLNSKNELVN